MEFKDLVNRVKIAGEKFPKKWNTYEHYIDLVEEVGELANAILVDSGIKSEKRRRAELKDSLADILFQLIQLANDQNIELDEALDQMLKELSVRQKNQEYEME